MAAPFRWCMTSYSGSIMNEVSPGQVLREFRIITLKLRRSDRICFSDHVNQICFMAIDPVKTDIQLKRSHRCAEGLGP